MARRTGLVAVIAVVGAVAIGVLASIGAADRGSGNAKSQRMSSYLEVPSVSTTAEGRFEAKIRNNSTIEYKLTYSGLEGTVAQAHIHFAQAGVNGGISAWLCETAGTQSPQTSFNTPCPQSGTVTGTITSAEVLGPGAQGIAAGQIAELIAAMRAGFAYANVHTSPNFGGGELRGQIGGGGGGGGGDDDDD